MYAPFVSLREIRSKNGLFDFGLGFLVHNWAWAWIVLGPFWGFLSLLGSTHDVDHIANE